MAALIVATGAEQGTVFRLKPGISRLGRHSNNEFQIRDVSVSSFHCEVTRSESGVVVRDLGSTNGTWTDGVAVNPQDAHRLIERLRVGQVELRLEFDAQGEDAPVIRVPKLPIESPPVVSGFLPDGTPACANHTDCQAVYRCSRCGQTLCDACVRTVRRRGGEAALVFCTLCSAACDPVIVAGKKSPKKGILGWLTSTLKLPFQH